jgi:hypothetical protein
MCKHFRLSDTFKYSAHIKKTLLLLIFSIAVNLIGTQLLYAQNTFPCDGKIYYFGMSNNETMLSYIDNYNTIPVSVDVCVIPGVTGEIDGGKYHIVEYTLLANPTDQYLYIYSKKENALKRLDSHCNVTPVCTLPRMTDDDAGAFDIIGKYWCYDAGDGLISVDISSCRVFAQTKLGVPSFSDFIFNPEDISFYGAAGSLLYKMDVHGNVEVYKHLIPNCQTCANLGYSKVAMSADGIMYSFPRSHTNTLYSINIKTGAVDSIGHINSALKGFSLAMFYCKLVPHNNEVQTTTELIPENQNKEKESSIPKKVITKTDVQPIPAVKTYADGISEETITEKGRIITRHIVTKNNDQITFTKIVYDWGGIYYFKNDVSISLTDYEQELKTAKESFQPK